MNRARIYYWIVLFLVVALLFIPNLLIQKNTSDADCVDLPEYYLTTDCSGGYSHGTVTGDAGAVYDLCCYGDAC